MSRRAKTSIRSRRCKKDADPWRQNGGGADSSLNPGSANTQGFPLKRMFGLRTALILLVLIAVIPVFGVVISASLSEQDNRLERAQASLQALADLSAATQEQLIEGARQMLAAVAHVPPVYRDDLEECARYFQRLEDLYPGYANFGLLDAQGNLVCRALPGQQPVNAADRLFFRNAVNSGGFSVGEYMVGRVSGKPSLAFGMPVYQQGSRVLRGVVFVAMDLRWADRKLDQLSIPEGITLLVSDAHGSVLASAGSNPRAVGSRLDDAFLMQSLQQRQARQAQVVRPDGRQWLYSVRPVGGSGNGDTLFVAVTVSRDVILAASTRRLYLQLAALTFITLTGALAAWFFGDRVLARPIRRMLQQVRAMERQESPLDLPSATGPSPLRELRQLDEGFRDMARTLVAQSLQRDAAMAEMAGQKNLLESVFESLSEGVLVADARGHYIHVNAAALRIAPGIARINKEQRPLEVSAQEYGFFHLDGVTPLRPEERPTVRALRGESVDQFRHLIRGIWSGGVEKVLQASARPLRHPDGHVSGCVLVLSDITSAYRAEAALLDSERRYRTLFESNPHPMWVFDTQTLQFLTVNDAAVAHYGYSREEFLSMTLKDIRPPEDVTAMTSVISSDLGTMTDTAVWRHRLKSGSIIFVEITTHALEFAGRSGRMVLAHDITARKRVQDALRRLNATLEQRVVERTRELSLANRELESFSYSVSHDLRAPLQAIDGFGRALVSKHADRLDSQAIHYLNRIRAGTSQMSQLIDDLLSLAKVTRTEIHAERVDLAQKARQIIDRLRAAHPQREVRVEIADELEAFGDSRLLAIVLANLLENAWKFTAREPDAQIRVGIATSADGQKPFFVADNGAGFDMAYVDKLFKAFQRLHTTAEFEGTGIGLATVYRIITRHGGRVWAEASPGHGAVFYFTLKAEVHDESKPDPAG
jgi:PAS domain S-box-containing protein